MAGTLVHTKEGLKPIEQIKVGDYVLSKYENGQGEQAYKRVTNTFKFENKEVMLLEIVPMSEFDRARKSSSKNYITPSEIRDEMKQHLVCTPNHPFWVEEMGWTAASMLELNSHRVQVAQGEIAAVHEAGFLYRSPLDEEGLAWFEFDEFETFGMVPVDLRNGEIQTALLSEKLQSRDGREMGKMYPESKLRQTVYNFEVEDFHTYYVGEMGVWVHNTNFTTAIGSDHDFTSSCRSQI